MARLEEFEALCRVVEQKSFSRAAESLAISQPAVSLQIKSLEEEYGVKLLHRDGFEVQPTEVGRAIYDYARQIVDLYAQSRQMARELNGRVRGKLTIGASTVPGGYLLPLLLGNFKARYPQVDISLCIGDSSETIDNVLRYRFELGFVGATRRDSHLNFDPFMQDCLVLVVPPEQPWAGREAVSYEELLEAPLILQQYGSGATMVIREALEENGIAFENLNIVAEIGLQESVKTAVRAGLGVTIISRMVVVEELARGLLVEVPVKGLEWNRNLYAVYRRMTPLSNLARTFLDFVRQDVVSVLDRARER